MPTRCATGVDKQYGQTPGTPANTGKGPILAPGTLVGEKFRIEHRIARGGQASVYLAKQEPLEREVALKLLSPPSMEATAAEREEFEQRFLLEARTLAALDHPNIVTVYDYGETDDGRYYLAMEYIRGGRFLDLLRQGHLASGRAVNLVLQVAQALRYAHKRGVVHRDVKNSNVLVRTLDNGQEQAKVVDFGLVKLSKTDNNLTQTGMILGSPHFMAPEQAIGRGVDHRADIYATGVLLYCGLTGEYPFDGPHATAIITAHVTRDVPRFAAVAPSVAVPEGLEAIVRRCLEKKPARRYPSMDALIADLLPHHSGVESGGISGEFNSLTARPSLRVKRDTTTIVAGVIVGGVIAALTAILIATAYLGYSLRDAPGDDPPPATVQSPAPAVPAVAPSAAPEVLPDPSPAPPARRRAAPPMRPPAPVEAVSEAPPTAVEPSMDPSPEEPPQEAAEPSLPTEPERDWADEDLEAGDDEWR
ncbi:MAG: serine/threonine-protein kinase [Myxococcota bacterium]|nr:serine/threonine-protein kinase [Myxococcota bacterium]